MGSVIVLPTGAASTTRQGLTQFEGISADSVARTDPNEQESVELLPHLDGLPYLVL
jgi:uncharacterized RmlC-like cupin family protein